MEIVGVFEKCGTVCTAMQTAQSGLLLFLKIFMLSSFFPFRDQLLLFVSFCEAIIQYLWQHKSILSSSISRHKFHWFHCPVYTGPCLVWDLFCLGNNCNAINLGLYLSCAMKGENRDYSKTTSELSADSFENK